MGSRFADGAGFYILKVDAQLVLCLVDAVPAPVIEVEIAQGAEDDGDVSRGLFVSILCGLRVGGRRIGVRVDPACWRRVMPVVARRWSSL